MENQVPTGCHAKAGNGQQCQRPVVAQTWFCARHRGVSTLDAVWQVNGKLVRLGDMSRAEAQALMDGYRAAATQAQQLINDRAAAAQQPPGPARPRARGAKPRSPNAT